MVGIHGTHNAPDSATLHLLVSSYEHGHLELSSLIDAIDAFLRTRHGFSPARSQQLRDQWEVLEVTFALMCDEGRPLEKEEAATIIETVSRIKNLLTSPDVSSAEPCSTCDD